jgi:phage-related minor tail protein
MSNENVQKQLDFIVEQQAQFVLNFEKADERLTRLENIVANAYVDMRDRYNALVDAQLKTEEKLGALADAQHRTEDRLNIFIEVVERHVSSIDGNRQ